MATEQSTEERFWSKVNFFGPAPAHVPGIGNCWLWTACALKTGHGQIRVERKTVLAHRLAWVMTNGSIPDDLPCVCHRCDTPRCVRPDHLFVGTKSDNTADMVRKGRARGGGVCGDRNGARLHPERLLRGAAHRERMRLVTARGQTNGNSKLTETVVVEMRLLHAAGLTFSEISRRVGIHKATAARIVQRKTWKHVP